MTRLSEIAKAIGAESDSDIEITGVKCDSRQIEPGMLFAALPGSRTNGADFAITAAKSGAAAIITETEIQSLNVPQLVVNNARKAYAEAANLIHGNPSSKLNIIAVTGTNGKSTVLRLLAHMLRSLGKKVGCLGTIDYDTGTRIIESSLTTPDAETFTSYLAEMVNAGCDWAIVEASSHALDQYRVWPHSFVCGIFTNLTRDHLDYHNDMGSYLESKKKLFDNLSGDAWAVINQNDPAGARLIEDCEAKICRYSVGSGADISANAIESTLEKTIFEINGGEWGCTVKSPLVGNYNVQNCLAALAAIKNLGLDFDAAVKSLENFPGVPGRLQRIIDPKGRIAFVDYAHTDDALRSVLGVLKPLVANKLICVFGCGGDRDKGKRPLMAKAAGETADSIILTSDNPRTEDPETIIKDVIAGFDNLQAVTVEPNRAKAIDIAVKQAKAGDVILVAGKGHEDYQIIGTTKHHMDDREMIKEAMERHQ